MSQSIRNGNESLYGEAMYRLRKRREKQQALGLDSLMDILTCTVGVVLFIVIFAALEAGGIAFGMRTPILHDPPESSERKLFICNNGRIRMMEVSWALVELLGEERATYDRVPRIVADANKKDVADEFFSYRLEYDQWTDYGNWWNSTTHRAFVLIIEEKVGVLGETTDKLAEPTSMYLNAMSEFDPEKTWFAFAVDEQSLEVFRKARAIALELGFAVGWDPSNTTFPLRQRLGIGGGSGFLSGVQ